MHAAAEAAPSVGFIGLGTMGAPMAGHVHRSALKEYGRGALVWNRSPGKAEAHAEEYGTQAAKTLDELGDCDVIFTCLSTSADVAEVMERLPIKAGALVIDCTSGAPDKTREIAKKLTERCGARFVDAPVSGGPKGAASGTVTCMLGGAEADVAAAEEWCGSFSAKVVRCGPSGAGDAVKAVNNVLNSAHLLLATEGLLALSKLGVPPDTALAVINSSSGRSLQTERLPDNVLSRKFAYGFALRLMAKDTGIAAGICAQHTPSATLIPAVHELVRAAEAVQGGDADYTEVARMLEQRAGCELHAGGD